MDVTAADTYLLNYDNHSQQVICVILIMPSIHDDCY